MSWFFNSDFEDFLLSNRESYSINSNKKNQEFEYFILWLESEKLFSLKEYDEDYLEFIEQFNKNTITRNKSDVKLWCSEIFDKEKQKKLNSKIETTIFGIEHNFCHSSTQIINNSDLFEEGYLYKEAFGVSGSGNFNFSASRRVTYPIVKEKKLDRTFDFSALVVGDEIKIYQNDIDNFFQYRGTTVGMNFDYFEWIDEYKTAVDLIRKTFQAEQKPMSIDSFLYNENGEEKCYVLSEVNNRKTMGYIAHKLKEKIYPNFRYSKLCLLPSKKCKKILTHADVYKVFEEKIILLSPNDNIFLSFMIAEDSLGELNELEDLLISTFFEDI